jgi:hypothetical protein
VLTLVTGCDHDEPATEAPGGATPLACRGRLAAEDLLPSDALVVGHYDMARERRFAPDISKADAKGPRAWVPSVELEAVRLGWVGIAAACELDPGFWGEAWASVDREHNVLVSVSGRGVGDPDRLRCIQQRVAHWEEDVGAPNVVRDDGCGVRLEYDGLAGFAPHDDLLVLGDRAAVDRARATWNAGVADPPTTLMPSRSERTAYVWAAADVPALLSPDKIEEALDGSAPDARPFANLRRVQIDAALGRRYALRAGARFGAETDARAVEAMGRAFLDAPPPTLPVWSKKILDHLELSRDDTDVSLSLPLSRRDAHELGLLPSRTEARQVPGHPWIGLALLL